MPVSGAFQSATFTGSVCLDALERDVILRNTCNENRILLACGSNVASSASVASDAVRVPVLFAASNATMSNAWLQLCETQTLRTNNLMASNLDCQRAGLDSVSANKLTGVSVVASNLNVDQMLARESTHENITCYSLATSNARFGNIGLPLPIGPDLVVTQGPTIRSDTLFIDTSETRTTKLIVSESIQSADIVTDRLQTPALTCCNASIPSMTTSEIKNAINNNVNIALGDRTTSVLSSTLSAVNLDVAEYMSLKNYGISSDVNSISIVNSWTESPSRLSVFSNLFLGYTPNNPAHITTGGCALCLGAGVRSNMISLSPNAGVEMTDNLNLNRNVSVGWTGSNVVLTGRTDRTLSIGTSNIELARVQMNAANRGGCLSFSNVEAGARVVLWQDTTDINAYGGLGKEPGSMVVRTPPGMGISFVTGAGALGNEMGRLASNGAWCINTVAPIARTHIRSSNDERVLVLENTFSTSSNTMITCMRSVGASSTVAPPSMEFRVNGAVVGAISHPTTSSTMYSTTSDRRLKTVLGACDPSDCLDKLALLRTVAFHYKSDPSRARNVGFLADEVQRVIPEAVTGRLGDPETYQMLDMTRVIPYIVAGVQALRDCVHDLAKQVEQLRQIIIK
jgi:hypothetical protein